MPELRAEFDVTASDGCRLAGQTWGERGLPALLLAHPIGFDRRFWNDTATLLSDTFRLIVPDARGHGTSGRGVGETCIERLADDMLDILDALGVHRTAIAGCSMGSATAMRLGAAAPERLDWLVLANAPAKIPLPRERFDAVIAEARTGGYAGLAQGMVGRWIAPETAASRPDWVAARLAEITETDPDGFADAYAALRDSDRSADLAAIAQPTLVVTGALDSFTPEQAEAMATAIPSARAAVIPGAAHLTPLEQPARFAALVRSFAQEVMRTQYTVA